MVFNRCLNDSLMVSVPTLAEICLEISTPLAPLTNSDITSMSVGRFESKEEVWSSAFIC